MNLGLMFKGDEKKRYTIIYTQKKTIAIMSFLKVVVTEDVKII